MNASVYKAETQNSQSYFVKLKRGHRYEYECCNYGPEELPIVEYQLRDADRD